jgi:signal transduction histidine kinase
MDDLIRDSLNYSKLLRQPVPLSAINLNELLEGIRQTYPDFQPPRVELWVQPDLPPVLGNAAALTECFSNLMDNAIKFAPPGVQPRVRIYAERCKEKWRIFVEDNGIGIAPDQTPKLFDIFVQLNHKTAGSTGIGLAIVRKAAERMRGQVGVESELGKGSRFWIELDQPHEADDLRFPVQGD